MEGQLPRASFLIISLISIWRWVDRATSVASVASVVVVVVVSTARFRPCPLHSPIWMAKSPKQNQKDPRTHPHTHTHTLVYRWIDGWMDGWMDRRRKRGKVGYRLNTSHPNLKHPATAEPPTEPPTEPPAEPPNQPTQTTSPATLQSPRRRCLFIYFFSCCFSYPSLPSPSLPCPPPISLLLPWINHVWLGFSSGFLSILPCLFV